MPETQDPYNRMVIYRLDQIDEAIAELRAEVVGVRIDVATLKVKAGIWGAAAGCLPALVGALAIFLGGGGGV